MEKNFNSTRYLNDRLAKLKNFSEDLETEKLPIFVAMEACKAQKQSITIKRKKAYFK